MSNLTERITRPGEFALNKTVVAPCFCCVGLGEITAREAISCRKVEWRGRILTHHFCAEHATVEPFKTAKPIPEKTEQMFKKVDRAIVNLSATGKPFTVLDIYSTAKVYPKNFKNHIETMRRLEQLAGEAASASRERDAIRRANEAIAMLEGRGKLSVTLICRLARISQTACINKPAVRDAIVEAVERSGGRVPCPWIDKKAS